ncbi:MAG: tRNA (N6-threonylcarbamoyladenosine(37)-N6)-methyltransferase TrmO [Christensenellales bacterium]|jgi:tRNA-Thr(GGU) m(6)t(6)A37 methyltransferase TsaA
MKDRKILMDGLQAVGVVHAETIPKEELRFGQKACIEIFEEYACALDRFKEHTHFWVLCWLDRAKRDVLQTYSWHLRGEGALPYGVFALRSPCRPNPVSLTLVRLLRREGNLLYVDGLDIFDKTPVLDIKPYMKGDVVFSPKAPYIRPQSAEFVRRMFHKKAVMHHQEECAYLAIAVRMALAAEEYLGDITDDSVSVRVRGGGCFIDTVQGLTNARFANPPRFACEGAGHCACEWTKDGMSITTVSRTDPAGHTHDEIMGMDGESLFVILFGKKDEDEGVPLRKKKRG